MPRQAPKEVEEQYGVEYCTLPELLKSSDIVSLNAPATEATRIMIDAAALSSMKPNAYLINVASGSLVDQAALGEALRKHVIAGTAIDVFAEEPPGAADPLLQVLEDKVLFSGIPPESAQRVMTESVENIGRALAAC